MSAIDDLLEQGIAAVKAGQRDQGRQLLQSVVRQDSRNEKAWLWLSGVLDSTAQRRDCLQRVLTINPDNQVARRGLEQIGQQEAASFLSVFEPHTPAAKPEVASQPVAPGNVAAQPIEPPETDITGPISVPIQVGNTPPANANQQGVIGFDSQQSQVGSAEVNLPPPSLVEHAPCYFCGTIVGSDGQCGNCGIEQMFDCPECGSLIDIRERTVCECGQFAMNEFLLPNGVKRVLLGNIYAARDYPGAAVIQWKAAIETAAPGVASGLHRKIAEVYLNLGLIEQARKHNQLSKQ